MGEGVRGALGHLRVLDLTSSTAAYCGKLLADLGADVLKVEPPEGDPARREVPQVDTQAGALGLGFAYHNANKRFAELDLERASDRERLRVLSAEADLLIESLPVGRLDALDLGWSALSAANPGLVLTSISGFGRSGPQRGFRSNDLVASALGGAMISIGDPTDPPVRLAGHQADVITATLAAAGSLVALWHRDRTGRGQQVDISALEAIAATTHIAGVGKWLEDDIIPKRVGTGLVASVPSGAYRCRDGLVYLMVNRPAHWDALAHWIHEVTGNEEVLLPEFRGPSSSRLPFRELLDVFIGDLTRELSVDEAYHEGQRRHIAFTPVQTAARIASDPHLRARDFFRPIALDSGRTIAVPGAPYRPARTPWSSRGRLAAANRDEARWRPRASSSADPQAAAVSGRDRAAASGALAGLRVVEFGTGLAAPWIGRILAWAGAEVIKVESRDYPDVPRLFVPPRAPELGTQPESSPWFTDWSAGKRFVALDLRKPEGAELGRRLVAESDAVIANYSTGVLEKLGLGYPALAERNPALVMLESTGYGESGPLADYVTWGPNIEALAGLCSFSGFPDRDCTISHFAYPDPLSALHGLVALLAALAERDRSGRGQVVHLSQFETTVASIGALLAEHAATGSEPPRLGNRERGLAPYGCFPCAGEDRWCVICVEDDDDWQALRRVMGDPEWSRDPRLASAPERWARAAELEARLADWTRERADYAVMASCQAAGLAAGVVQSTEDLFRRDVQLRDRGFFEDIPHFKKGQVTASGIPLGLTQTPGRTRHAGSAVGQDNERVLCDIVGLTRDEFDRHVACGAIEEGEGER